MIAPSKLYLILIIMFIAVGATMFQNGVTEEKFEEAVSVIDYDGVFGNNFTFNEEGNNINNTFVQRLIFKVSDVYLFAFTEGTKESFKYGYYNPQYNWNLAWKLLIVIFLSSLIVPLIYIILFVGYFIKMIIEWIKKKRGKK